MARRQRQFKKPKKKTPDPVRGTYTIKGLAHRGDGIAVDGERSIFISHTLQGETVEADVVGERGTLVDVLEPAKDRVEAPCEHYLECGGCNLQHMENSAYLNWKREQVIHALEAQEIELAPEPIIPIETKTRRRATFSAARSGSDIKFGFQGAKSHRIEEISSCLVIVPEIEKALPKLRSIAAIITPKRGTMKMHVLMTDNGLDIRLDDFGDWPDFETERALMNAATKLGLARISLGPSILIELDTPSLHFGDAIVPLSPGAFTQATAQSEQALVELVVEGTRGFKHVADLFAGSGTFALNLAKHGRVHAAEGDKGALQSLEKAARATPSLKPVTSEQRDLFRRPFMAKELRKFDTVVLDPPRAGAKEQCAELAKSSVETIVYVSCSPSSFARDAKTLIEGGYSLNQVFPVDQFLFSHHIELVGTFNKGE